MKLLMEKVIGHLRKEEEDDAGPPEDRTPVAKLPWHKECQEKQAGEEYQELLHPSNLGVRG
jgi:hypothetical protein